MRYLKMLGLLVVAAAILTAVIGASTVSATVICKNNLNTETCSEPYPIGAEGTASVPANSSLKLTDTSGNTLDTCKGSTVTGKLKSQGKGEPARSELSTLTFSTCTFPTSTLSPGSAELHWIKGTDNGTLTTGGVDVTIKSILGDCRYGLTSGTLVGTTVGGNPGSLSVNAVVEELSPPLAACPDTTKLTGEYVATSPTNGWVSNG